MKNAVSLNARLGAGVLSALLACAAPAIAQTEGATPVTPGAPAAASAMSIAQVIEHLAGRGYNEVREVERKSDKLFEVKARDAKGAWVELTVDARSGEVLKSELDR